MVKDSEPEPAGLPCWAKAMLVMGGLTVAFTIVGVGLAAWTVKEAIEDLVFPAKLGVVVGHGGREARLVKADDETFAVEGRAAKSNDPWKAIAGGFTTIEEARQAGFDWLNAHTTS